jgi:hypothetical protein
VIPRYGSYNFDTQSCEVTLNIQTLVNRRNVPYALVGQMNVAGYLAGADTTAVNAACVAMEAALEVPYRDLVVYTDAGAATHLALYNNNSTTGVVIDGPRYPRGKGVELVTLRYFEFTGRAEYPIGTGRGVLMSFQETVTFQGTGGPKFILKDSLTGLPQRQVIQQRTRVSATQQGQAEGYLDYPTEPPPLWPAAEHVELRRVSRQGGTFHGKTWQGFTVSWHYQFEAAAPLAGRPTLR